MGPPLPAGAEADQRSHSRPSWIGNFVLVFSGIVLGTVMSEIAVRIFAPQPMTGRVSEYAPRGYFVIRSSGSVLFTVGESTGVYHFISPHLRRLQPPPAHAARILALGDSFTFGQGLREEDTFVAKLQEKIDATFGSERVALLNGGIGGSGTADHMAFLEDFGDVIAPRAVIVFVSIDDFNRAQRSPLYRLRDANTLQLVEGQVSTSMLKRWVSKSRLYDFAIQHIHLAQLMRQAVAHVVLPTDPLPTNPAPPSNVGNRAAPHPPNPAPQSNVGDRVVLHPANPAPPSAVEDRVADNESPPDQQRLARALFRRMKAWCDTRGVKLAVINNGWRAYQWLPELLASEGIASFDAAPQIRPVLARGVAPYSLADGHPNRRGDKLIADAGWPFLRDFIIGIGLGDASGQR